MTSSNLLSITTFIYGAAAFFYLAHLIFKKQILGRLGTWTALIGVAGNIAGIIMRWVESYRMGIGHAPLSNMYESLVFFAGTVVVVCLFIERKSKNAIIGAFATPIAFLAMAYASMSPNVNDRIQPLVPALKSNWLIAHVIACFLGYAAFAIAFGISIMYLFKQRDVQESSTFAFSFSKNSGSGRVESPNDYVWFSLFVHRYHYRFGLGEFSLGQLLVLGPERDLVSDYLVYLCNPVTCQDDAGMVWQTDRLSFNHRIYSGFVHLFRCEPPARFAQLWVSVTLIDRKQNGKNILCV